MNAEQDCEPRLAELLPLAGYAAPFSRRFAAPLWRQDVTAKRPSCKCNQKHVTFWYGEPAWDDKRNAACPDRKAIAGASISGGRWKSK